jgi:A/G-specific adenine glycosylase
MVATLLEWFADNERPLPWRSSTAWGVLVSEFMLQQTPVDRVLPVWQTWLERWPTPADMAQASLADVLRAWGRLGYPRRARRLHETSAVISEQHGGQVPDDRDALLALPGVGDYTAAAILAFAYQRRSIVLDTNVRRVVARTLDGVATPLGHITRAERCGAGQQPSWSSVRSCARRGVPGARPARSPPTAPGRWTANHLRPRLSVASPSMLAATGKRAVMCSMC